MRAVDITTDKVRTYIGDRQDEGMSNGEINRELAALKRMFNLALQQTPPKVSQKPYIPMLQERNVRKGFFEQDEFVALRSALPLDVRPVVTFAHYTGWRKRDILWLTWDRVDLQTRTVRLEPGITKNRDGRTIYLDGELFDTLVSLKQERDLLFHTALGCFTRKGFQSKTCAMHGRLLARPSGSWGSFFHAFRRTAVRDMIRVGIPERVAQQISSHKTRSFFDRHHIVSHTDLREAAKRQGNYAARETVTKTATIGDVDQFLESVSNHTKS
jgi:integrase